MLRPVLLPILEPVLHFGLTSRRSGGGAAWSPATLFANGEQGGWYDPSDLSTMFQDAAGTTPVTGAGQPVRRMLDKSGRGNHATAPNDASRPILRNSGDLWWLEGDGFDDIMSSSAVSGWSGTGFTVAAAIQADVEAVGGSAITVFGASADPSLANSVNTAALQLRPNSATLAHRFRVRVGAIPDNYSLIPGLNKTEINILTGVYDGKDWTARLNGAVVNTAVGDASLAAPGDWPIHVNFVQQSGKFYGGLMIDRVLTAPEMVLVETWLLAKSGVSI